MARRDGKGRFLPRGGGRRRKTRRRSTALVRRSSYAPARRRSRRRSGGGDGGAYGMPSVRTLGIASLVGFMTTSASPHAQTFQGYVDKVPGAKTFGRPAAVGVAAWAINRYIKPHPLLREVAKTGLIIGAARLGEQGYHVTWVGDDDDLSDVDDVEDVDYSD